MTATTESPLRAARLRAGYTFRTLAETLTHEGVPVDHSTLVRIENGETSPRPALRAALAKALGIDPVKDIP